MTPEDDVAYGDIMYTWFQKKAFNEEQKGENEDNDSEDKKQIYTTMIFSNTDINMYNRLKTVTVLGNALQKKFLR